MSLPDGPESDVAVAVSARRLARTYAKLRRYIALCEMAAEYLSLPDVREALRAAHVPHPTIADIGLTRRAHAMDRVVLAELEARLAAAVPTGVLDNLETDEGDTIH
jgi:hypothetical protein